MMDIILPIIHEIEDNECIALRDNKGSYFASCIDSVENAEFIVKACNEYYPMIKIINALIEKLDDDVWMLELSKSEFICTESIKQIIKQAEEQS